MFICLFCGQQDESESAKFCSVCGNQRNWNPSDIDRPEAITRYYEFFCNLFFDESQQDIDIYLNKFRERNKISFQEHSNIHQNLISQKANSNVFSKFEIEFDNNVLESFAGHDTYLRFRFTNLSNNDLYKVSIFCIDPEQNQKDEFKIILKEFAHKDSPIIFGGSYVFLRMGVKELSEFKITVTNQFDEFCTFRLSPIRFRVNNPNQEINQFFSTKNQISIEGRGIVDNSGVSTNIPSSSLLNNINLSDPKWVKLYSSYIPLEFYQTADKKNEDSSQILSDGEHDGSTLSDVEFDEDDIQSIINSADKGSILALNALGKAYYYGKKVEKNIARAFDYFMRAALAGNASSQNNIGTLFRKGVGVTQDFELAIEWFTKAANQNLPRAQWNLGALYLSDEMPQKNIGQGIEWLKKSASQNFGPALRALGKCYLSGTGVPENPIEAKKYFEKAIEVGNDYAIFDLAELYLNGRGVIKDLKIAAEYLLTAAYKENQEAQYKLAFLYYCGEGVPQDFNLAKEWATKAAKSEHISSCELLGDIYSDVNNEDFNYDVGIRWYKKAIELGSQSAAEKIKFFLRDDNQNQDDVSDQHNDASVDGESDPLYQQACSIVYENKRPSISLIQRHLRIGYNRAARLLNDMTVAGLISEMNSEGNRTITYKFCKSCGVENFPSDVFCSNCKSSIKDGKIMCDRGTWYGGIDENNCVTGYGNYFYPNGDRYEGYFFEGFKNGDGKYSWKSGDIYEGNFVNDMFHGFGKYYFSDGQIYEGHWHDDKRHGEAIETYPDGSKKKLFYVDDKVCN
jgi:TPR repeat protein